MVQAIIKTLLFSILRKLTNGKIFFAVVLVITTLDVALLEQKFNIFRGGFLQTDRIATLSDRLLFVATILSLEAALAGCFWYLFMLIGLFQRTPVQLNRYRFMFVYGGASVAAIIMKYKILSYFGDFLSIAVLRNLGGGSLQDAMLYALEEGLTFAVGLTLAASAIWYCYHRLKVRIMSQQRPITSATALHFVRGILFFLTAVMVLTLVARANPTMRKHLPKITPYALANETLSAWIVPEPSALMQMKSKAKMYPAEPHYQVTFPAQKDNLIFIVSESTRADVLDTVVNGKPVVPNWRAIAAEGSVAREYYSHTGFTTSSLKAIFQGTLGTSRPLDGTLFEILKKNGYQVVVLSGQDESFGDIAKESGAEQSTDIFFDARSAKTDRVFSSAASGSLTLSNDRILQQFDKIAARIDWQRPTFFYINLQAAHFPYYYPKMPRLIDSKPLERSEISENTAEKLKLTYLNAVAYSDWATGQLLNRLKNLDVYRHSLVAVSGDHGESLFDDGILGHGIKISDSQLHTLLVTNRHLPALSGLLGQTDLAKVLLLGIGAKLKPTPLSSRSSLIQIIGDLREPSELGYIYAGGQRLTLDNVNGEIHASWLQQSIKLSELRPKTKEYDELLRLTAEWSAIVER